MTVRSVPIFLQAGSHPAEETRLMLGGMLRASTGSFAGGAASSDPAHGVVRSTDLAVSQNGTPNMSVNVATGGCFIRGTQNANQGAYHLWNDGTVNLAISAADATNPRRDLIIAQVRDAAYSGASNDARILVVTGTPAASPSDPSLASYPNALVLARVAVAAGATSIVTANITDLRTVANVHGQVPEFATTAARSIAIPSPYNGQLSAITSADTNHGVEQYNGTSWRKPWSMPWGIVPATSGGTSSRGYVVNTTTQTGITAEVALTSMTITFTAVANRLYRCSYFEPNIDRNGGVSTGFYYASRFRYTNTSGTQLAVAYRQLSGTNAESANMETIISPSAGSTVVIVSAQSENGTMNANRSATAPALFYIEDIGPSGAPV